MCRPSSRYGPRRPHFEPRLFVDPLTLQEMIPSGGETSVYVMLWCERGGGERKSLPIPFGPLSLKGESGVHIVSTL
jgi:hypothetical protein